jgi:hypothetical protein
MDVAVVSEHFHETSENPDPQEDILPLWAQLRPHLEIPERQDIVDDAEDAGDMEDCELNETARSRGRRLRSRPHFRLGLSVVVIALTVSSPSLWVRSRFGSFY